MAYNEQKLDELACFISRGITPSYTEADGMYVINQKCIRNGKLSLKEARLHNGSKKKVPAEKILRQMDILVNSTGVGTLGRVAQVTEDIGNATVDSHVTIVRPIKSVDPLFLGYAVKWRQPYLEALAEGSTGQTELSRVKLGSEIAIPVPLLEVQQKIGAFLAAIDAKIAVNEKINDNLQQQLSAIFREWFIDSSDSIEWPRSTFADLIDHTISGDWGKDAPTGNYTEMVYCIRGADIPEVKAGNKGKMPTRFILPKNYAAKKLVDGDIVVEISGGSPTQSTGRAAPVSKSLLERYDRGMVCTNFCKAIKPKRGYSMFVYHYWQHLYDAGVFFGYENGTTGIKNLDINGFIETEEIVIPPLEIIERFDSVCQAIANMVYANGLENERLKNLRDALLPKLMSGEIDVSTILI